MNQIAKIGDNNPPSPFDEIKTQINDLYEEAKQWLDGELVTEQTQADALNLLITKIKEAEKTAEEMRVAEVTPLNEKKNRIQALYNPLIQDKKGKTSLALISAKKALEPFLLEQDRLKQVAEAEAKAKADEAERVAQDAMLHRDQSNLAEQVEANNLADVAKDLSKAATKVSNTKVQAKSGTGRATGLRTVKKVSIADRKAAAIWLWADPAEREELMIYALDRAQKAVRAGAQTIEGFNITQEKVV